MDFEKQDIPCIERDFQRFGIWCGNAYRASIRDPTAAHDYALLWELLC
jgi:hypothetical protein